MSLSFQRAASNAPTRPRQVFYWHYLWRIRCECIQKEYFDWLGMIITISFRQPKSCRLWSFLPPLLRERSWNLIRSPFLILDLFILINRVLLLPMFFDASDVSVDAIDKWNILRNGVGRRSSEIRLVSVGKLHGSITQSWVLPHLRNL
jgi:hypothetical protein